MIKYLILLLLATGLYAQQQSVEFSRYFENKALRVDYYHVGNATNESITLDALKEEPYFGGSKKNLIDPFNYGKYLMKVYDQAENTLIFSKGYSTLFSEWQTTAEAKENSRVFSETLIMPYPKARIRLEILSRNRKGSFDLVFSSVIDPKDYFISAERNNVHPVNRIHYSGDADKKVDIVILPDGYTKKEMMKFEQDCKKFAKYFFNSSPFRENEDKFNIYAVEAPSGESGVDIPKDSIWKNTVLNSSFYTFDEERYLMTYDNKSVRSLAANAPYDQIYILVNTSKYGGGSIYNHYSVCVSNNKYEEYIFTHEFGHGFVGLADEYYTSSVAYIDFYPKDVEPWEANITTLVDFNKKWKDKLQKDTPIPTPENYGAKLGVYEGGGYMEKGIYRPSPDCTMKSISVDNFCPVCNEAITKMINYYSE